MSESEPLGAKWPPQVGSDRVGYDMDGVICTDPWDALVRVFDAPVLGPLAVRWHHSQALLLAKPVPEAVIITGRLECDRKSTKAWLHKHGIFNPIFMNPWTPEKGTDWKEWVIGELGITHYIESDHKVAAELSRRLPHVTVTMPEGIR